MKTRLIQMILLSGAVWTACGMDTARAEAVAQQPSQTETAEQVSEEQELEAQATTTPQQTADRQQAVKCWTLQECLDYALENNIQLRQNRNDYLSGVEDTKEARAALLPSLTASTTQAYTNYPSSNVSDNDSYTGTYGVNADLVLYQGGMLRTTVRRQQLQNRIDALTVEEAENDIRLALVEAYMQALYASEAVEIAVSTAEVSRAQRDRAREMWRTGSISKVDFAQIESQYVSDEYQVVVARTTLDNYKLQLKQLLELDITDEMELAAPAAGEDKVVTALPQKTEIYATALDVMPEIRRGDLSIEAAELEVRQARAGFLPSVSLTAGIGTGYMSGGAFESGSQIWNRFNENVGLSLNIPIFSNRKTARPSTRRASASRTAASNGSISKRRCCARSKRPIWMPSRPSRSTRRPSRSAATRRRATT